MLNVLPLIEVYDVHMLQTVGHGDDIYLQDGLEINGLKVCFLLLSE